MANEEEKKAFLREVKQLISSGRKDFIKRTYVHPTGRRIKWIEALLEIGLTNVSQAWDEALMLTPNNYHAGPVEDRDRPKDGRTLWIFKKDVNGVSTYIKIKIDHRGCVCLSFHEDW